MIFDRTESNALHAGLVGVANAIPLVASIAACLIAFLAFLDLLNSILGWGCRLVDISDGQCTIQVVSVNIFLLILNI